MKKSKNLLKLAGSLSLAAVVCAPLAACGPTPPPDDNEPYAPPAEWHEDYIDDITMFCNDWEQFNNGAAVKSPVYKELDRKSVV